MPLFPFLESDVRACLDVMPMEPCKHFESHDVKDVIFNPPATIVLWDDGTKTVVKCNETDTYDERIGLLMCIVKKAFGNTGKFNDVLNRYCPEEGPMEGTANGVFNGETLARLEDGIHKLSDDSLMATYHMLNQWEIPGFLGDVLGLDACVRKRLPSSPKEIANRTVSPIMAMVKNEIVDRQHDHFMRGLNADLKAQMGEMEKDWESYNRER